jgi:hypothetical protein
VVTAGLAIALLQRPGGGAPPAGLHWALVASLMLGVVVLGAAEVLRLVRVALDAALAAAPRQPRRAGRVGVWVREAGGEPLR